MKVLVVEDDPGIADVLEYSLHGAGFEVTKTSSGSELMARETGLTQVALGGGVFQNAYLLELLLDLLPRCGLTPLIHSQVPPNDGGLALGQAVIAAAIEEQRCA